MYHYRHRDPVPFFTRVVLKNEYKTYKRLQTLRVKTLRNEGTRENLIRIITMRAAMETKCKTLPARRAGKSKKLPARVKICLPDKC